MWLERLGVEGVRNLVGAELNWCPGLNVLVGDNGAGKTSVLEAVYLLSRGRSFRTGRIERVISNWGKGLRVTARVRKDGEGTVRVGMERGGGQRRLRVDGEEQDSIAALAGRLPVLAFEPGSHELVEGGPGERRRFLDWGVFHVEPQFLVTWRRYHRALKQRNAALRSGEGPRGAEVWEPELAEAGDALSAMREAYADRLRRVMPSWLERIAPDLHDVTATFHRGWPEDTSLPTALESERGRAMGLGYTTRGPHRCDLLLKQGANSAAGVLSRGQQKLLALAMVFAQCELYARDRGSAPILLLDDLSSELDVGHQGLTLEHAADLGAQVLLTALFAPPAAEHWPGEKKLFHVERGRVTEVVE